MPAGAERFAGSVAPAQSRRSRGGVTVQVVKPILPPERRTELTNTGERFLPSITRSSTGLEHYHRYLAAAAAVRGKRVLDIACGEGYGSFMLAQAAAHVYGADIDRETVVLASRKYGGRDNLDFLAAACGSLPLGDDSVDCVVSFETIEHIHEQQEFLREVKRVLAPGGMLIASSPNRTPYNAHHDDNHFHEEELEKEEFRALLAEHFAHVELAQQQALYMSLLSASGGGAVTFIERHEADGAFHFERDLDALMYSIAFASDAPLPPLLGSALLDTTFGGEAHAYTGESAVYEIRDPGVSTMIAQLRERAAKAEAEVARLRERVDRAGPEPAKTVTIPAMPPARPTAGGESTGGSAMSGLRARVRGLARALGVTGNPLKGAAGPSNTMQPLPRRVVAALGRTASRAALWAHRLRPKVARSIRATNGLFDPQFYRRTYYDVSEFSDTLCAVHYAVQGWREGRRPGRLFDPEFYLRQYPDVGTADMSPLLHYVLHGADEWRARRIPTCGPAARRWPRGNGAIRPMPRPRPPRTKRSLRRPASTPRSITGRSSRASATTSRVAGGTCAERGRPRRPSSSASTRMTCRRPRAGSTAS